MRRRPRAQHLPAIAPIAARPSSGAQIGLVLSGGGARAAYQAGVLRALIPKLRHEQSPIGVIVGSSIGAVNGLVFGACLKHGISHAVEQLADLWSERTYRNTFKGSPSQSFFKAIRVAVLQYLSPGPHASRAAIFDPSPLLQRIDGVLEQSGGLEPHERDPNLRAIGVMTTIEGPERKPLLFLSAQTPLTPEDLAGASFEISYKPKLTAKHGMASAALPSILPPVELDAEHGSLSFVDGGISQNVPVDPAVRLGADRVLIIDISGRHWWHDRYGQAHDSRPSWEVPAGLKTYCLRPPDTLVIRNEKPFGPILKGVVGTSTAKFIRAVGPVWPLFSLLNNRLGEEAAYEVMSYVALEPDFMVALIERGFNDTRQLLQNKTDLEFSRSQNYQEWEGKLS